MAIFQNSVVKRFLDNLESSVIDSAYERYKEVYSVRRIHEIKKLKEEQYQEGFIKDIFGKVLGYTIPPESPINIELEKKNETDAKKADGAIIKDGKVIGVIELKDNKTKNLDKVKDQAFGYKHNHKGCKYVISSNFQKLRFYIDDATEYEEFDLYNLDKEQFSRFYLFLSKERLLDNDTPEKIKKETKFHEEEIGNQLYKDYSTFKNKFFNNIVSNNPQYDKLLLFKKSQKFLDRILFILFAEDKRLIPENAIIRIVESWEKADDLHYKPLYELFNILFTHLNEGFTYKSGYEIPAYNGGLFAKDEVLDNIKVDDSVLKDDLLILSKYDFNTEVDVNILGHIFEHSLTELEQIEAEIKGEVADKTKGKRKKDGVFYTPKYITKYIVDNTIGKLCDDKRRELKIDDFDVNEYQNKSRKLNSKGKALFNVLENYKEWLFELKIVDPACGSGAFLNQALTYLIEEHKFIDDLIADLTNTPLRLFDTDKAILEKNIYGVDINEESVDIAKLSLWLRTAQRGRKLSNLSNNIKCGNSLVNDVEVAGDKAFDWEKEFSEVFEKGGFDVVIGNPPYVRQELFKDIKPYLEKHYRCYNSVADLYTYFIEKGITLMNNKGLFSFILPNKFLKATYGKNIRKVIKEESNLDLLLDFDDYPVFADATTYPIIYVLNKNKSNKQKNFFFSEINKRYDTNNPIHLLEEKKHLVPYSSLTDDMWNFIDIKSFNVLEKLKKDGMSLGEFVGKKIYRGLTTGKNEAFIIDAIKRRELIEKNSKNKEVIKVLATGKEVKRNTFDFQDKYLLFTGYNEDIPNNFPDIQTELDKYKESLIKRYDQGENYWNLRACAYYEEMQMPKIIYPRINNTGNFYFDEKGKVYLLDNNFFISTDSKPLLALLNSKLIFFYLKNICTTLQGGFYDFRRDKITTIPIPSGFDNNDEKLFFHSDNLIELTNQSNGVSKRLVGLLQSDFSIEKVSKKIENWHTLKWDEFEKELKKKKVILSGIEKEEWFERFTRLKKEVQNINEQINQTDKEIDQMIYELYGLTEDEIKIVEES